MGKCRIVTGDAPVNFWLILFFDQAIYFLGFVVVVFLFICTCPSLDVNRFHISHTNPLTRCTFVYFAAVIRVVTRRSSPLGRSVAWRFLITAAKETKEPLFSSTFSFVTLVLFTPCLSSPNFEHQWFIRDLFSHIGRSLYFLRWLLAFFFPAVECVLVSNVTFPIFCTCCMLLDRLHFLTRTARFLAQLKMFVWLVGWLSFLA